MRKIWFCSSIGENDVRDRFIVNLIGINLSGGLLYKKNLYNFFSCFLDVGDWKGEGIGFSLDR